MANLPVALQLYTVRDDLARDFAGTLEEVARIGYAGVEFAGYGGLAADDLRRLVDRLGLQVAGAHVGLDQLEGRLPEVIAFHRTLGNPSITVPFLAPDRRQGLAGYRDTGRRLGELATRLRDEGFALSYHNHAFEFDDREDGVYGFDALFEAAGPGLTSELDTYWVQYGGEDPVAYLRKYAGRVPLVHLKDMEDSPERAFAEVGTGVLDVDGIIAAANEIGSRWIVVEQDVCKRPPLESVRLSFENLKAAGHL